jgi:hypothetical protein
MMIDFNTLKQLIISADSNGTLITQKHDPDEVNFIYTPFRSVVSKKIADNLLQFINDEKYSVKEYQNLDKPLSPLYFTLTPYANSQFIVPSSGVTGNIPTSAFDTLILVSGVTKGIHMFGNSSTDIQNKIANGSLINERILKQ